MPKDPKTAKKVTQVPPNYIEDTYVDPLNPNRKYYKKSDVQAAANPAAVVVRKKPIVRGTGSSVSARPRPKKTLDDILDRVYTEPDVPVATSAAPIPDEADSFMGDVIFDSNKHAVGMLRNRDTKKVNRNVEGGAVDTGLEDAEFMYIQPDVKGFKVDKTRGKYKLNTTDMQAVFGTTNMMREDVSSYFNKKKTPAAATTSTFAGGGKVGSLDPYSGMAQSILGGLTQLLNTSDVNAMSEQYKDTVHNLQGQANPYGFAMGGDVEDMDEDELEVLQMEADSAGMSLEDYLEQREDTEDDIDLDNLEPVDEDEVEEEDVQEDPEESMNEGYGYGMGGQVFGMGGVGINVEDDEILEDPNGNMVQMDGDTHEEGGIPVNVQKGTKIYSDRLKVDGKTMQERKAKRERTLADITKKLAKDPSNQILKSTLDRTTETHESEDAKDMQVQKIANKIYGSNYPKSVNIEGEGTLHAMGGFAGSPTTHEMMGQGDEINGDPFMQMLRLLGGRNRKPLGSVVAPSATTPSATAPTINRGMTPNMLIPKTNSNSSVDTSEEGTGIGLGDALGIGGNIFNAVTPLINSRNAAKATKPNINRWRGYGHRAIEANESAQDYVAGVKTNAETDIDTNSNAAYVRNRDSASSVNTIRALDAVTTMGKNKAKNAANDDFSKQTIQLLDQNGRLTMAQDQAQMGGQERMDVADKQDVDNYYSNMAGDLMNFGTNVQGLGKNLNKSARNKMDIKLIAALSKHGLTFDKKGNLISLKK